ncbi:MAG: gliding motility-associated C-terminal domain-containing protein [Bacteroidota bacterium]
MKKLFVTLLILFSVIIVNAQGTICSNASPFCTGTTYTYPASTNVPSLGTIGCLYTTPNPAWYWMQVGNSGNIDIHIASGGDVDFICWGPYTSLAAACASNLTGTAGIDCSYSAAAAEDCNIPNAVSGQVYVLLITNYANISTNITFSQTGGTGTTNCGIVAPPITNNGPLCVGQTLQLSVTSPTPGATYSWTGPNGFSSSTMNPSIPNVTTANAGVYSMTITIGSQTSPPVTTTVVINPNPDLTPTVTPSNICVGASSTLSTTSSVAGTSFVWQPGSLGGTPVSVSPLVTTTYTVTGTALGCTGSNSVTLTVYPNPVVTPTVSPTVICNGASVSLSVNSTVPGTMYTWMPGNLLGTPTNDTPATTTTYTVTGTAAGCTGTSTVTVTVNPNPVLTPTATPSVICEGSTSSLNVSSSVPGSIFSWMPGTMFGTPVSVTPSSTTTYTVSATAAGCTGSNTVTVTVNPNPIISATATPAVICNGSSSSLSASSTVTGTAFTWMPGNLSGSTVNVSPTSTTVYTVSGTASGCSGTNTVTVTVNPLPVVTASASPTSICNGSNSNLTANSTVTGTSFLWLPGNLPGASISVSPTTTTTYTVNGSINGCTGSNSVTVTVKPNPVITPAATPNSICLGVSASLSANSSVSGTNYTWMPGSLSGNPVNVTPGSTTTYTVNGLAAGCSGSSTVTVNVFPNPIITPSATPTSVCLGSSSLLSANSSVSGTNFVWMPGNMNGSPVSVIPAATTTYTVTGVASGCSGTSSVTVTVNPIVTATTAHTNVLCNGDNNGSASVNVVTGTSPYTYHWSTGGNASSITNVGANTYSVTITDMHGCDTVYHITITQPPVLTLNLNPLNENCLHSCDGSISSMVNGGTGNISYLWSNAQNTPNLNALCTGNYSLTVTDSNGCTKTSSSVITTTSLINASFTADPESGILPLSVNFTFTGSGATLYSWNFGDGSTSTDQNPVHVFSTPGTYTVILIASSGAPTNCTDSASVVITVFPPAIVIVPNVFTPNGDGSNDKFVFKTEGLESLTCDIFDRWGKKIFEFTDSNEGWDGKTKAGSLSAAGVYYYIISAKGLDGKPIDMNGTITLVR